MIVMGLKAVQAAFSILDKLFPIKIGLVANLD
jgi:hypothetical protein